VSIFSVADALPVLPSASRHDPRSVTFGPWPVEVVVAGQLAGTSALLSTQFQETVTGVVYHPLRPAVPDVTAGVADGVVALTELRQPAL
jgi:hypothetical protein